MSLISPQYPNILIPTSTRKHIENMCEDEQKSTSSCFRQLVLSVLKDKLIFAERNTD